MQNWLFDASQVKYTFQGFAIARKSKKNKNDKQNNE